MPELLTSWVSLAASTRGMEADITRGIKRASDNAVIELTIDSSRFSQQADDASRDFTARFQSRAGEGGGDAGSSFMDGFSDGIAGLGTKAGPIGAALMAAGTVAIGAGAFIAKQVMAGMEQEASADLVQARLGIDEASMARISDAAGKAYANNFGESMQANMSAAQTAIESGLLTGADDPGAQQIIERLSTVSQLLGEEIPAVSRSASQAIRTGLVDDASEAFDLLVRGQQAGLNVSEDWLDTLNEYGTQFRKLGLDGTDALGLLSQMTRAGARDTDVAADAIKEFSIRAIDGSEATNTALLALGLDWQRVPQELAAGGDRARNAFGQVLEAIQRVEDPVQRASLQVALFGTQSEDLGNAINAMDLSNAAAQFADVDGAAQRASDTMADNTASSVETARRVLETGAASMQRSMADAFGPSVQQAANWLTENQDSVAQFFTTSANAAAEFGGVMFGVGSAITGTLGMILQATGDTTSFMLDRFADMAGGAATIADAVGMDELAADLKNAEGNLTGMSDKFDGMGNGLLEISSALASGARNLHDFDANMGATSNSAANAQAQIAGVRDQMANLPTSRQIDITAVVVYRDQQGRAVDPAQLLGFNPSEFANAGAAQRARRGDAPRPGDLVAAPPTPRVESVTPSGPSLAAGPSTPALPATSGSSGGGSSSSSSSEPPPQFDPSLWRVDGSTSSGIDEAILANVPAGRYTQEERGDLTAGLADCSSAVEDLVNLLDGRPTTGASMSTHNADEWLTARGFVRGEGGLGDMRVAFNSGHMQATLPDGTPFNWGSDSAAALGGRTSMGADDPALTSRYYRPVTAATAPTTPADYGPAMNLADSSEVTGPGGYVVDPQAVYDAESATIRERNELEQKNLALLELKAKGNYSQSQLLAAENAVAEQKRALTSAEAKEAEARRGKFKEATDKAKSATDGSSSSDGQSLGKGIFDGILQGIGLDGSLFSNPFEWPNVKSAMAVANFGGGLLQQMFGGRDSEGPGASETPLGGSGGGLPFASAIGDLLRPQGLDVRQPRPGGAAGGGAAANAAAAMGPSLVVNGNVGWDPREMTQQADAHRNQVYRSAMNAVRPK